jgi:glycosyltransferase involved in cell wall biosynthesis
VRLLYHGGLAPRFGVESAIEAFALLRERLPRLRLRICGAGEPRERARLTALAAAVDGERIDVAPEAVPFAAIPAELERAHIGIVPTLRDPFTELLLPVKLLEYVHMGLPVVCSELPCIGRHFSPAELAPFAPGDPRSLAAAIAAVCEDPAAARARAARATARLAPLAWARQRERYLELVGELTGGRPGASAPASAVTGATGSAARSPRPSRAPASPATRSASSTIDSPLSSRG